MLFSVIYFSIKELFLPCFNVNFVCYKVNGKFKIKFYSNLNSKVHKFYIKATYEAVSACYY